MKYHTLLASPLKGEENSHIEHSRPYDINFVFTVSGPRQQLPSLAVSVDPKTPFFGGLIDSGAQRSVIGMPQALAYMDPMNKKIGFKRSNHLFRFGNNTLKASHCITIEIPTPSSTVIVHPDVVSADIPFLIGLDVMRRLNL